MRRRRHRVLGACRRTDTFHVDRARFDELLFRHAAAEGATTLERFDVVDPVVVGDTISGVTGADAAGRRRRYLAEYVVDASGMGSRLSRRDDPGLRRRADRLSDRAALDVSRMSNPERSPRSAAPFAACTTEYQYAFLMSFVGHLAFSPCICGARPALRPPRNSVLKEAAMPATTERSGEPRLVRRAAGSLAAIVGTTSSTLDPPLRSAAQLTRGETETIQWNNGATSTFEGTAIVSVVGGEVLDTRTGSITGGLFRGDTAVRVVTLDVTSVP
jgi:hypothetical protein